MDITSITKEDGNDIIDDNDALWDIIKNKHYNEDEEYKKQNMCNELLSFLNDKNIDSLKKILIFVLNKDKEETEVHTIDDSDIEDKNTLKQACINNIMWWFADKSLYICEEVVAEMKSTY
jgi:hypothetical protein